MRKKLVLFIITLLVITLSSLAFAEDFAIKVNNQYTISVEEFNSRVARQNKELEENQKKNIVINGFVKEVMIKEALKEEGLKVTEDDFYSSLRRLESLITSKLNDTYPLGHFSGDNPPKEKIMKRLVEFDEFDFTYDEMKRSVRHNAGIRKLKNHFKEKLRKEFEENEEEKRKELKEYKEQAKEEYAELTEEQKEFNAKKLEKIKNMTLEEFAELQINNKAPELFNKLMDRIREELKVEINEDL